MVSKQSKGENQGGYMVSKQGGGKHQGGDKDQGGGKPHPYNTPADYRVLCGLPVKYRVPFRQAEHSGWPG